MASNLARRPLQGIKVLEFAGLAPAPYCGQILSDFGADVVRIDRGLGEDIPDTLSRGKKSIAINLKSPSGIKTVMKLVHGADALVEPFRPGVMERLGLGPDVVLKENPRIVYARMTGYGQDGSKAHEAGHDINYIGLSGVLSCLAREGQPPHAPVNLLGDFAGGGLMCALGIVMALFERTTSGKGQVVDAAMVDGAANIASFIVNWQQRGMYNPVAGTNLLDGGAPFYDTYRCKDGKFVTVGAIEPQFYAALLQGLSLDNVDDLPAQMDQDGWPQMRKLFTDTFMTKTRDEWTNVFDGSDACVGPVLNFEEARVHPHNVTRKIFQDVGGEYPEVCAAPRLSRTPAAPVSGRPHKGQHTVQTLREFGFSGEEIKALVDEGAVKVRDDASKL
eukprot:GFYU01007181.1.p1 GENE.GFYU01007181.1~~GFYU01007181.1.p1  ORF type:complete len:390 (-),score=96.16 GFYU01007181.1:22-1191(-)